MARKKTETAATITPETLEDVYAALEVKGLDPDTVPAEFADSQSLKSRELADLTETKGQVLLSWLNEIPDDQPVEPDNEISDLDNADAAQSASFAAADNENADSDNDSGNGVTREEIRKAEDVITIKRPLTPEESQSALEDLYELESRRTSLEFELDGFKSKVKACQKEIESVDTETYRIIRDIKANAVEEEVEALRITNHTTGMITWYDRNTGEVLKERAINSGEQLPLDLAGEAADHADESPAKPDTARVHGKFLEETETGARFLVQYQDDTGSTDVEFEIPHGQIIDMRTRVLDDEPDCIIVNRAYAIEVGLITESGEDTEPEDDERGCSICAHSGDESGDACQTCMVDDELTNFTFRNLKLVQPDTVSAE